MPTKISIGKLTSNLEAVKGKSSNFLGIFSQDSYLFVRAKAMVEKIFKATTDYTDFFHKDTLLRCATPGRQTPKRASGLTDAD
jgi:hypothetical protein